MYARISDPSQLVEIITKRLREMDIVLSPAGMTINLGEDEDGNIVYRIEQNSDSRMAKVAGIIAPVLNGALFEALCFDVTVKTEPGMTPGALAQSQANAIMIMDAAVAAIMKIFMAAARLAVLNESIMENIRNEDKAIAALLVEAVQKKNKEDERKSNGRSSMEPFGFN